MTTTAKIENYMRMIENIRYENEHGGAYAYVQFLAYNRELMFMLNKAGNMERYIDSIESVCWLFNEYLAVRFTHRQKVIFENKFRDMLMIFNSIRRIFREREKSIVNGELPFHAQAA